jgi:Putative beta-barrel porin-2, OmpL-like. bbp2
MFDLGMIKDSISNEMKYWQSYGASVRYGINDKWGIAGRYEHINDLDQIIDDIITYTPNGFQFHDSTLTLEYLPTEETTFRIEARHSLSKDVIFTTDDINKKSNSDFFLMFAVAIKFKHWGLIKINKDPALKDQF